MDPILRAMVSRVLSILLLLSCAAHSAEAGAWTISKGVNWLKVGLMLQETTERYFIDGERIPYFFDGRNQTRALFFEYVGGITHRWDVKAQLPFFNIAFDDIADERTSNGPGDLRIESRYNLVRDPLVLTVGGAIKFLPGSSSTMLRSYRSARDNTMSMFSWKSAARCGRCVAT